MCAKAADLVLALQREKEAIAKKCYPAFDELLTYTLERRHLDIPSIQNYIQHTLRYDKSELAAYFQKSVRLFLVEEIAYDAEEEVHLPGVEACLSAMRDMGHSVVYIVQGERRRTRVYIGVVQLTPNAPDCNQAGDSFAATLAAHFPGSKFTPIITETPTEEQVCTLDISDDIRKSIHVGVLTGIPSLKREEDRGIFVQGLERLIRSLRGKSYTWMSIADPIPQDLTIQAMDACRDLQSDIHHFVKRNLSDATSKSKTVQMGLFGMLGIGVTDGKNFTQSESVTESTSTTHNLIHLEDYQRVAGGATAIGAGVGLCFGPIGSAIGAAIGAAAGAIVNSVGAAITGKSGHSVANTTGTSHTIGWADTTSRAMSEQMAGGGFGSIGFSWTRTTTVGVELLNRKMEYVEELLQKYEERLREGYALGMWNLGHYFCANDEQTYRQGCGVINSLFAGMDSQYEPPRAIKLAAECVNTLQRFSNIYFMYGDGDIDIKRIKENKQKYINHPLGIMFNGPATPVNTRELAIAMPMATQDVEGVSVSKRPSFGLNLAESVTGEKNITLGEVLDKGLPIGPSFKLRLDDLTKHLAIFGLTGSGKTNTMHHMLIQLWNKHRIPFLVIEPAKSEYRAMANIPGIGQDLLIISAGINQSSVCPLRMNPFAFNPGKNRDANRVHVLTHIDRLKATFNSSFPMYASMPYILEEAILQVYRERGWDLGRSVNRYVDIYREDFSAYLPTLYDLYLKVDSIVQSKGYYQEQQMNIQAALKARLASLMVGAKGSMFNCLHSIPDEELWNRPVVVELDNMGDDDEKAFLMGLLVSKLYEYRKATDDKGTTASAQPKHVLVIEEAHRLLANIPETTIGMETANVKGKAVSAFIDMLSEIRAMGQSVMIVDQLPSRVSPNIVKGTGAKIVHRLLAKDDREAVGHTMGLNEEQIDDMSLLHTGECVVSQNGDRKSYMCRVRKVEEHETRVGSEVSAYTKQYKEQHADLFDAAADFIGKEDSRILESIHKMMMAIACGQSSADLAQLLNKIAPHQSAEEIFSYYWKIITQSIWNYNQGDYSKFVNMARLGELMLSAPAQTVSAYKDAVKAYFTDTYNHAFSKSGVYEGTLFRQIFEQIRLYAQLDRNTGRASTPNELETIQVNAINRTLPLLGIPGIKLEPTITIALIKDILLTISPNINVDNIIRKIQL